MHRLLELEILTPESQRRAVDRGERRTQLVRHRRDEILSNLLERALFGEVAECVHRSFVEADPGDREPPLVTFEVQGKGRCRRGAGRTHHGDACGEILPARQHLVGRPAHHLAASEPGDRFGRAVPEPHDSVAVDEEDAVGDGLQHTCGLGALFGLAVELCVFDRGGGSACELFGESEVGRSVAPA